MNFYYIQQAVSSVAVAAILVAAIISCTRIRRAELILQVIGAGMMIASITINHLIPMRADPKTFRLDPVWVWRLEQILSCIGLFVFAAGYAIERVRKPRENI
jgi:hypothetical protein